MDGNRLKRGIEKVTDSARIPKIGERKVVMWRYVGCCSPKKLLLGLELAN